MSNEQLKKDIATIDAEIAWDLSLAAEEAWQRIRAALQAPPAAAVPPGYVPVSALIEAREEVESWAAYASPYFQDKHDLAGVLAKIDGQIAAATQAPPAAAVPEGMVERIEAALKRIEDGHCIRRIPADPTDPDLVLAEVLAFLQGGPAPFWTPGGKQAPPAAEVPENFAEWLAREMPAGTVIGDPHWWANLIARRFAQFAAKQAPPAAAGKKYMNWQPIETAPKDGCVIMLWCGDVDFGYYSKAGWRICNNGDYRDGGHGQDYLCGTDPHSQYAPPTHWMPLPEPPKDAECSQEGVP
jgi:hypothetical protein